MRLIKMVSVGKSSMGWDGKPFWGLVVQKGPWKSTPADIARAKQKDISPASQGIETITPYQVDASGTLPEPSSYAKRSVVMGAVDMKRQGAKGTRKNKLTLGARTPVQTGHKMGNAPEETGPLVPPSEIPDLLGPSDEEVEMVSSATSTGPFVSEYRRAESRDASMSTMTPESRDASVQSSKPQLSTMRGEPVSFTPKPAKLTMSRGRIIAIEPEIQDVIMAAPARQLSIARGGTVSIEPWLQLPASQKLDLKNSEKFLKTVADFQTMINESRIEKMSRMDIDEPMIFEKPAGVETGRGKKVAMSKEALGKEADVKGLPFKKTEKTGKVPKPKKGPSRPTPYKVPVKSRFEKKKKQPEKEFKYQPVTERNTNALLKRLGSKIAQRFKAMKKDDVQYEVTKAAYEKWLKKK